jgi:hypothetical protein
MVPSLVVSTSNNIGGIILKKGSVLTRDTSTKLSFDREELKKFICV